MSLFKVVVGIEASPERVWDVVVDWEGSARWMVDATTVEVLGQQREGVGTRVRAVTRIAGVRLTDEMEVVGWWDRRLIQVMHNRAPIKGLAWFAIAPAAGGTTRFEWGENLTPPLGALGEAGGRILRAPIQAVLGKSATKLKTIAERR